MSIQHNAAFNELIYASVSECVRVSNTESDFINQFKGTTADPIPAGSSVAEIERSNDVFNLGVYAGATHVIDTLHAAGYTIHDPEGVKLEPAEGSSFSDDFFGRKYWEAVSN